MLICIHIHILIDSSAHLTGGYLLYNGAKLRLSGGTVDQNAVKELFINKNALLAGHFLLSSGLHSNSYFQSALILQYPLEAQNLAKELGLRLAQLSINPDLIVSPALGGVILGHELGRFMGKRAIFTEKVDGKSVLRRGFSVDKGQKAVIVEDVITTGLSTREVINTVCPLGADIVGVVSLVDRSAGKVDFGVPKISLLSLEVQSWTAECCPLCKEGSKPIKPGSRK
jgi:orotate phosphoribosyltransferase